MSAYVGISRVTLTNQIPALNGTDGWTAGSGTLTADTSIKKYSANSLRLYGGSLAEALAVTTAKYTYVAGHKYYVRCEVYFSADTTYRRCSCYWPIAEPNIWNSYSLGLNLPAQTWNLLAISSDRVAAGHTAGSDSLRFDFDNNKAGGYMYLDGIMLIDLTAAFGAGKEPTQSWCNENIAYFTGTKTIAYSGAAGVAIPAKKLYIGVNGVARRVVRAYVGVDGVARRWWDDT